MTIDGTPVRFSGDYGAPFLDSAGRTQVPFRRTLEVFGCTVSWENPSRTAWAEKDGVQVAVPIGQPWMTVNGHRVDLDTAAQIRDNRTYLPIRPVLEAFGAYVTWDGAARQVVVTTGAALVRVHFLDVGQGDAFLVRSGANALLIDTGNQDSLLKAALARQRVGRLVAVAVTHSDDDHCGSLSVLGMWLPHRRCWCPRDFPTALAKHARSSWPQRGQRDSPTPSSSCRRAIRCAAANSR